jgi:myo-inositol catabolism protein IolC
MTDEIDDAAAIGAMAANYGTLCETWDKARAQGKENAA